MHAPTIRSASAALLCGLLYSGSTLQVASATCPIRPASLSTDYGFGSTVVLPGDLNGDGADDFVIGAAPWSQVTSVPGRVHIYFGGPLLNEMSDVVLDGQAPTDLFGYAVAGAGDLNGDGHVDLVVGAFHNDAGGSNCGRAYVYFGGPGLDATADLVLTGEASGDEFGIAVAGIGDANGDGYDDLLVGARYHGVGSAEDGRAYVYFGGPGLDTVPDAFLNGQGGERLGFSVSRFDDVNGDGRAEFVVGAYYGTSATNQTQAGRAYVCTIEMGGGISARTLYGDGTAAQFSAGLGAGDVDGDGRADLIVGAPGYDNQRGRLYVYSGGPGFDTLPELQLIGPYSYESFGRAVAGGADVTGDGHGDLVVGAPGNYSRGRIYVYAGGPAFDGAAEVVVPGEVLNDSYGFSVAAQAGSDVNGDSEDDVLVGAPTSGTSSRGRADFPLSPCVLIDCPADLTVSTGQPFDLQYTISNCENTPLDLNYTISNSDAWCTTVMGSVSLDPGESAPVTVSCMAPDVSSCDLTNSFVLTVKLAGCLGSPVRTCTQSTTRRAVRPVLGCAPDVAATPDTTVTLAFSIHNPSAANQSYRYTISDSRGWCPPVTSTAVLFPGMTAPIFRTCTVPAGVTCDIASIVEFSAYNTCTSSSTVKCQTRIGIGAVVCANLLCPPDTMVAPGEPFERRVRIVNCSTRTETYEYVVADDQGWGPALTGSVTIAGLDTASVVASFVAPLGTPCTTLDVLRCVVHHQDCTSPLYNCSSLIYTAPRPDALLALLLSGPATEPGFGVSTAMPGDLNADGHEDFVVGATTPAAEGDAFPGRAYVYFGGPGADATPDVVLAGEAAGDRFGYAVARAGDLNSDGYPDLAVGAYQYGPDNGRIYAFFGGPGFDAVPDFATAGLLTGEQFGIAVDGAGDVNADGHDDLLVGARLASAAGTEAGRAYVFFGGPSLATTPPFVLEGHASGERMGFAVAGARDLNGDHRADLLVGADYNSGAAPRAGRVYAYYGGPSLDSTADLVLGGTEYEAHFGVGLAATDVDGDTHADVLVGATGSRRVTVFLGGPGIDGHADLEIASAIAGDSFGRFVSGGADFDGDGFGDFVVGAPGSTGRVYVYLGGPVLDATCDGVFAGEAANDQFGFNGTATGADLNADGAEDLLVGAFQNPVALSKANALTPGRAYVYSALYPIPVVVEDWTAIWEGGAVSLGWRLAGRSADEGGSLRVQRSEEAAGPYADRTRLLLAEQMQFVDHDVEPGRAYWYRLVLESEGESTVLGGPYLVTTAVALARTALDVPYETTAGVRIAYRVGPASAPVIVDVHDIAGRRLRRFEEGLRGPGAHALDWDERDGRGVRVARGVYVVRLTAGSTSLTRKIVVLRP